MQKSKEKGYGKGFATLKVKNPELHHEVSVRGGQNNKTPRTFVTDPELTARAARLGAAARWAGHSKKGK
jgi:hypothetical protein